MEEKKKHAGGRPTKYDKKICEGLPERFKDGQSLVEVAVAIGVTKQTIYNWMDQHEEFLAAVKAGLTLSQAWWEKAGRAGLFNATQIEYGPDGKITRRITKSLNTATWIFNMCNRFKEDWRQSTAIEHSGPDGGPVIIDDIRKRDKD